MGRYWGLCFLLLALQGAAWAQSPDRPNILLVVLDDQNDYVRFLGGQEQALTPHVDRLASQGVVFEQAYCNSPICAPSRTSFLTGKDPDYSGVYSNSVDYDAHPRFRSIFRTSTGNPTVYTLPEVLKDSLDYFTANFYKVFHGWSNDGHDNDFDRAEPNRCQRGLSWNLFMDRDPNGKDPKPSPVGGEFREGIKGLQHSRLQNAREGETNDYIMVDSAMAFLDRYADDPGRYCDRPFFAAVGLYKPHAPWNIVERYYAPWYNREYENQPYRVPFNTPNALWPPNGVVLPGLTETEGQDHAPLSSLAKRIAASPTDLWGAIGSFAEDLDAAIPPDASLTSPERVERYARSIRANALLSYMAASSYADAQFGRLWARLEAHPELARNTVIVLISDHGYSMGEHRHFHKASLWETDLRVPMIVYDPRHPEPKRIPGVVSLLDLMPTVLEMLDGPSLSMPDGEAYLDGYALQPMMEDPELALQRPVLSGIRYRANNDALLCSPQYSVRGQRYHYIHYTEPAVYRDCDSVLVRRELYEIGPDRQVDPEEWNNLASDPRYAPTIAFLSQWLPDGPLFGQAVPAVQVQPMDSFCRWSATDSLRLRVDFRDEWGRPLPVDTLHYGFQWVLDSTGLRQNGPSTVFPLTGIDSSAQTVLVTLLAWPLADSAYTLVDQRRFAFGEAFDPSFAVQLEATSARISAFQLPLDHRQTLWSYGDGLQRNRQKPDVHAFSSPGHYRIQRSVRYGPQGQCLDTFGRWVQVPDSLFAADACPAPTALWIDSISSRQIRLRWSNSAHAIGYRLRYQNMHQGLFAPSDSALASSTEALLTGLEPQTAYDLTVQAACADSVSAFAYPLRVQTAACAPPGNFSLSADSAQLHWTWSAADNPAIDGQRLSMVYNAGVPRSKILGPYEQAASAPRPEGLHTVRISGSSICGQVQGPPQAGPSSLEQAFVLPMLRVAPHAQDVLAYPNPTSGLLQVQWPGAGTWELVDLQGRQVLQGNVEGAAQQQAAVLDLSAWTNGIYLLHWQGGIPLRSAKSTVVKTGPAELR